MPASRTSIYIENLSHAQSKQSAELRALKRVWREVQTKTNAERRRLAKKIHRYDPLHLPIDLLRPIERATDENTHTRVLSFLLDPNQGHGLGKSCLIQILQSLPRHYGAAKILRILRRARTQVSVTPEHRYLFLDGRRRAMARCDIWIEISHPSRGTALVVIENKVDAPEGNEQLTRYEAEAERWRDRCKGVVGLIYLTRENCIPKPRQENWANLSYTDLAAVLREVWNAQSPSFGKDWLALYIATVMRHVVGIEIEHLHRAPVGKLERYLGERTRQ